MILFLSAPLYGQDSRAVAVLLDVSKSLPRAEFEQAKQEIVRFAEQSNSGDSISIYAFGNASTKLDLNGLKNLKGTDTYTALYDAAYDAAQDLAGTSADRKAILIISDGYDTKSVTILEDVVAYANRQNIAIYGIGAGKANRKTLERLAKLTGARYFDLHTANLANQMNQAIVTQRSEMKEAAIPPIPSEKPSSVAPAVTPGSIPAPPEGGKFPIGWVVGILAVLVLLAIGFAVTSRTRTQIRTCPTCGRRLDPYQTICPDCSAPKAAAPLRAAVPSDGTQEIPSGIAVEEQTPIPVELLEKKPVTEEMLSRTFVLMETPMLEVRRGKTAGQSFSLNRAFPVSIGRSKVNEIPLDDVTVSGQHCRIIPENGKHVLYDLGSTNGTFVNDKKVQRVILQVGDMIKVGETHFLYKIEQHRS
jgi:hypothetical protein